MHRAPDLPKASSIATSYKFVRRHYDRSASWKDARKINPHRDIVRAIDIAHPSKDRVHRKQKRWTTHPEDSVTDVACTMLYLIRGGWHAVIALRKRCNKS